MYLLPVVIGMKLNVVHFTVIDHVVFNSFLSCAACLNVNLINLVEKTDLLPFPQHA